MNIFLKRVTYFLLLLISMMITSSMGDLHIDHDHDHNKKSSFHSHGAGGSHDEEHGSCSGESILDHLFDCVGGISGRDLLDETYGIFSSPEQSFPAMPAAEISLHLPESSWFPELNHHHPAFYVSLFRAQRAPPLFV